MNLLNHSDPQRTPLNLSGDGYIRLSKKSFQAIPLSHLESGLYSSEQQLDSDTKSLCGISGYTEWHSETIPSISIGWDWTLKTSENPPTYEMIDLPFSNVHLQDDFGEDLPLNDNLKELSILIKKTNWKNDVKASITNKYS
mgnify:CR=1 FL=1